jgi:futalosine hydrolase
MKDKIAVIAATVDELGALPHLIKGGDFNIGWKKGWQGKGKGCQLVLIETGIGKVNAAVATSLVIKCWSPSFIVLIGIAGAYPSSGLKMLDIALATEEVYGDEGCMTSSGWLNIQDMETPYLVTESGRLYHRLPLHTPRILQDNPQIVKSGPFVTLSAITGTAERAKELEEIYPGILCENMEGAAVAHVAAMYGIPVVEIRAISNKVGPRERHLWKTREACENVVSLVAAWLL